MSTTPENSAPALPDTPPEGPEPTEPALQEPGDARPDAAENQDTGDTADAAAEATEEAGAPEGAPAKPVQASTAEVANGLKQRFPALFTGPAKPLKLRIQADIQERAPGVFTKQALSAFLRRHTGATSYLMAVAKGEQRFDLDGQPAGELTQEHRDVALVELARRREVTQARRREEAQAHRQQNQQEFEARRQEQDARRERYHLLRDFEHTTLTPANFGALKGLSADKLDALLTQARAELAERPPQAPRDDRRDDRRGARPDARPGARRDAGRGPDRARPPRRDGGQG